MAARIDVGLAQNDSYVFWHDEVSKGFSFSTGERNRHPCRSRQSFTTAIQCTVGSALDFDTLGAWLGI